MMLVFPLSSSPLIFQEATFHKAFLPDRKLQQLSLLLQHLPFWFCGSSHSDDTALISSIIKGTMQKTQGTNENTTRIHRMA